MFVSDFFQLCFLIQAQAAMSVSVKSIKYGPCIYRNKITSFALNENNYAMACTGTSQKKNNSSADYKKILNKNFPCVHKAIIPSLDQIFTPSNYNCN